MSGVIFTFESRPAKSNTMLAIAPNGLLIPSTLTMDCDMRTIIQVMNKSVEVDKRVERKTRSERADTSEVIIATLRTGPYIFALTNYGRNAASSARGGHSLSETTIIDVIALCDRLNRINVSASAAMAVHTLHVHSVMELLAR